MSMEPNLMVRSADVVTASDHFTCDIGARNGRIIAFGRGLLHGGRELDVSDLLALPGGIDGHCYLDQPVPDGTRVADDFFTGTRAAICDGTTTVTPFATQEKDGPLKTTMVDCHHHAEDRAIADYDFHLIMAGPTSEVPEHGPPELVRQGYTSSKVYMTHDDLKLSDCEMPDIPDVVKQNNALVMVHAENADCVLWLTEKPVSKGHISPRFHGLSRPAVVEREATHRIITFAELMDMPILIVHVSGKEAIKWIRWAQSRGLQTLAETYPQYLYLTAEGTGLHGDDGYGGAKYVRSPPPHDPENQAAV